MSYHGDVLYECRAKGYDFTLTHVVVVSGDSWNPCGHAILNAGGSHLGYYLHVGDKLNGRPLQMNERGYQRYLRENKKRELSRRRILISKPDAAQEKLDELVSKNWLWLLLPHNCTTFVEQIIRAGGSNLWLYSNCPSREAFR